MEWDGSYATWTGGEFAFNLSSLPQNVIFCADDKEVVRVEKGGKVIIAPDVTLDEASKTFWEAVQRIAGWEEGK